VKRVLRRSAAWLGVACLSAACASQTLPAVTPPAAGPADEDDLVSVAMAVAAHELLAEGYQPQRAPERGFLAPSMRALSTVTVAPRSCVAIAAAATPSVADLDAALYAADGSVLAEDDSAGPRPVLRLCSAERGLSAHLALYAFQGAGSYAVQQFVKPLSSSDAPEAGSGEGAASAQFLELLRSLHARGYREQEPQVEVPLVPGAPLRVSLSTLAGHCYSVVADGDDALLRLLGSDGSELSRGLSSAGAAALQHCASSDGELSLELSARASSRRLRVARLWSRQGEVGGARSLWLGEPAPTGFDAPVRNGKGAAKQGSCEAPAEPLLRHQPLAQGSLSEAALPGASACVLLEVALHEGLARVTLRVEDAAGATLAERELSTQSGSLYVCPKQRPARASLIARAGFGAASLSSRACREDKP
jgi:hypothetical protein